MKFSQFVEYNIRNISVEKTFAKCLDETIPRPLSKKSKLSISLDPYYLLYAILRAIEI